MINGPSGPDQTDCVDRRRLALADGDLMEGHAPRPERLLPVQFAGRFRDPAHAQRRDRGGKEPDQGGADRVARRSRRDPVAVAKPQQYADFLDQEISFFGGKQLLLVVMPNGYGAQGLTPSGTAAAAKLPPPAGRASDDLAPHAPPADPVGELALWVKASAPAASRGRALVGGWRGGGRGRGPRVRRRAQRARRALVPPPPCARPLIAPRWVITRHSPRTRSQCRSRRTGHFDDLGWQGTPRAEL